MCLTGVCFCPSRQEADAAGKARVQELVSTLGEMQQLLVQTQERVKEREAALEQNHARAQELLEQRDRACEQLTKELELANSLLQDKGGACTLSLPV